ncbi:MFS family permease [Rhodopseudomonas julia]|uniref:MFS family permease n=1 Tax=Rhodopseudomonas julia TaxID=200617 RepID=A0ABU0C2C6_9BRAD|nr:MFS transporter [Rhodopseudomonas julia]MDQ0324338.1 MFS family permease [Rhodopseudomonas julia]
MAQSVGRWTILVCLSRVFLYASFMTGAASIPVLQGAWGISATRAGAVVSAFTLSYSVSLFLFAWASDYFGAKRMVQVSAVATGITSLAFGLFARDWSSAIVLYGLNGLAQGGIYTPLVMVFSEMATDRRRGTAMGWLIGSTSVGYAFSLALTGAALSFGGWQVAFVVCGATPAIGAVLILLLLRETPNTIHRRPKGEGLFDAIWRARETRLLTAGYVFHCWELLGGWAWMPALLAAAFALSGHGIGLASGQSAILIAAMHLLASGATFSMGGLSDRLGRKSVLVGVAALSTGLSFSIGWLVAAPLAILITLAMMQAVTSIADSPVLTVALTETTTPGVLGKVLAVRSLLGFGAGAIAPMAAGSVLDLARGHELSLPTSWGLTFSLLGLGGLLATWSAVRLRLRG